MLANGQVAYMRWEYVDRFHMGYHHLWVMNPDGTRQMILYGNQINHGTILAPKSVPHSPKLVVTWSPGHGMREHYGKTALIDPRFGPDDPRGVQYISKGNIHCDPWAFSENHFLVANKTAIELMNGQGETEVLYRLPEVLAKAGYWIGEPRPVMKREREPVIADHTDPAADHGCLALVNLYSGRKMKGVKPGTVKNLLIYEALPKPINYAGAMSEMSAGGTFSVERLIGSVPVSEDGSAYFKLPPLRSFLFVAMDEKGHCVKAHALVHVGDAGREDHLHRLPREADRSPAPTTAIAWSACCTPVRSIRNRWWVCRRFSISCAISSRFSTSTAWSATTTTAKRAGSTSPATGDRSTRSAISRCPGGSCSATTG